MEAETVYPGLTWTVVHDGPRTKLPTYLACAVYRHKPSVDAMVWTVMTVGRDVTAAMEGDWDAARRQGMTGGTHPTLAALALVCVDTTDLGGVDEARGEDECTATVLSVDGEWMTWADALRWCVKGRTNLQDAVEEMVFTLADRRGKRKPAAGPVDPFAGDETAADKQRREASQEQTTHPTGTNFTNAVAHGLWQCDDCKAMNAPHLLACVGCGLPKGQAKPATEFTPNAELLAELKNMQAEHDRTCLNCGHKWRAAPPAFCPSCNCPTSEVNLDS